MKNFPNVATMVKRYLGFSVNSSVTEIEIRDITPDVMNKVPKGQGYSSEGGYVCPGYAGELIDLLYPDGQKVAVEWDGEVNSRNSYSVLGERVVDAILRHQQEHGLPKAVLFFTGSSAGQEPEEWKLVVYLWGRVGESLLREISGGDEARVLRALDYPWRQISQDDRGPKPPRRKHLAARV